MHSVIMFISFTEPVVQFGMGTFTAIEERGVRLDLVADPPPDEVLRGTIRIIEGTARGVYVCVRVITELDELHLGSSVSREVPNPAS